MNVLHIAMPAQEEQLIMQETGQDRRFPSMKPSTVMGRRKKAMTKEGAPKALPASIRWSASDLRSYGSCPAHCGSCAAPFP